jgi:hypothetical protein
MKNEILWSQIEDPTEWVVGFRAMPIKKIQHEEAECMALCDWAALSKVKVKQGDGSVIVPLGDYLMMVPNGSHLAGSERLRAFKMARMKRTGFKKGAHDYFLALPVPPYHGLWLEAKRPVDKFRSKGEAMKAVSGEQEAWATKMAQAGYAVAVGYGYDHMKRAIIDYIEGNMDDSVISGDGTMSMNVYPRELNYEVRYRS